MIQAKFTLEESQLDFLNLCKQYGFKDKSSVVRAALDQLQHVLELEHLRLSADLYAELYENDPELQALTESARIGWPE
jgi:hypothetical protein